MGRRIWIVSEVAQLETKDFDDARAHNCPEIVNGIPPVLSDVINESSLPMTFEEPEHTPVEPSRDLAAEIDDLKDKISVLEKK